MLNFVVLGLLLAASPAPRMPTAHLYDPGQFLSGVEQTKITQSLSAYANESKHEVIVYIDRTTAGQPAAAWGRETFDRWRAERPSLDDGVAVFLFTDDGTAAVTPGAHVASNFIPERSDTICRTLVDSIELNRHDAAMDEALVDVRHAIESPMPGQHSASPAASQAGSTVARETHGPFWDTIDRIPRWGFELFGLCILGVLLIWAILHPRRALQGLFRLTVNMIIGAIFGAAGSTLGGSGSSDGGGASGGGGSFGGGGASGGW